MQLIFQPTTCGDTQSRVSLVNTETKIHFHRNFAKACDQWAENFSHYWEQGQVTHLHKEFQLCLLGYLVLLGTYKVVVKAKLILRLLDVWTCLESGQRSQSHTAINVWGSKAIMLLLYVICPWLWAWNWWMCTTGNKLLIVYWARWTVLCDRPSIVSPLFENRPPLFVCFLFTAQLDPWLQIFIVLAFTQNLFQLISYDSRFWIQSAFSQFRANRENLVFIVQLQRAINILNWTDGRPGCWKAADPQTKSLDHGDKNVLKDQKA